MKITNIMGIKEILKTKLIFAVVMALMLGIMSGCDDKPNNGGGNEPPPPLPPDSVKISLEADIQSVTIVKSTKNQTEITGQVGMFMKKNQQQITTPGAVFAEATNLPMTISGKTLVSNVDLYYPSTGHVDFVAYYPYTDFVNSDFTIGATISTNQTGGLPDEILYSRNATNQKASETPVMLNFRHSLVKIVLHTIEGRFDSQPTDFPGMTATLQGAYTKANLQLSDGSFTGYQDKQRIVFHKTGSTATTASYEALILPVGAVENDMVIVFQMAGYEYPYRLKGDFDPAMQYDLNLRVSEIDVTLLGSTIIARETYQSGYIIGEKGTVTTICGINGNNPFAEGRFGVATFRNPGYLVCDAKGNLYMTHQNLNLIAKLDFQKQYVSELYQIGGDGGASQPNAPCVTPDGLVLFPANGNNINYDEVYWEYNSVRDDYDDDIDEAVQKSIKNDNVESYFSIRGYKHSFAYCAYDEKVYYRGSFDGALLRFNPKTGVGEYAIDENGERLFVGKHPNQINPGADDYRTDGFLVFGGPSEPYMLYAALMNRQIIVRVDIRTGEEEHLAGTHRKTGWIDGTGEKALFNNPRQIAVDKDGNLFIVDENNHCIRKLDVQTRMVSTFAGTPWKTTPPTGGYMDGPFNGAQFNGPYGIAVCPIEGNIYVAERGSNNNRKIRKLWLY